MLYPDLCCTNSSLEAATKECCLVFYLELQQTSQVVQQQKPEAGANMFFILKFDCLDSITVRFKYHGNFKSHVIRGSSSYIFCHIMVRLLWQNNAGDILFYSFSPLSRFKIEKNKQWRHCLTLFCAIVPDKLFFFKSENCN